MYTFHRVRRMSPYWVPMVLARSAAWATLSPQSPWYRVLTPSSEEAVTTVWVAAGTVFSAVSAARKVVRAEVMPASEFAATKT